MTTKPPMPLWRCAIALLFAFGLGCGYLRCETPLERERRELREAAESSDAVLYRGLKVALRSAPLDGSTPKDPDAALIHQLTTDLLITLLSGAESRRPTTDARSSLTAADYLAIAKAFYQLRDTLRDVDEDRYPTLLAQLVAASKRRAVPLPPGYTSDWEHLILAMLWTASRKAPPGFVIYELEQLDPAGIEEADVRVMARLFRALAFFDRKWTHLADEEAPLYLAELQAHRREIIALTRRSSTTHSDEQIYADWHAAGVLLRGLARHKNGEEEPALVDFEAFLVDAETIGLQSEAVWLVGAYVGLKREDSARALDSLRKLEGSPLLGDNERRLVREAIVAVEARDPDAALNLVLDKVLVAQILGSYIVRVVAETDWRAALETFEEGRALLRMSDAIAERVEKLRGALSDEERRELQRKLGEQTKEVGGRIKDEAAKVWERTIAE